MLLLTLVVLTIADAVDEAVALTTKSLLLIRRAGRYSSLLNPASFSYLKIRRTQREMRNVEGKVVVIHVNKLIK